MNGVSVLKTPVRHRWGRWWLDMSPPASLNIKLTSRLPYSIELSCCRTERARLEWLFRMAKQHVTAMDISYLRRAFRDLVGAGVIKTSQETENSTKKPV